MAADSQRCEHVEGAAVGMGQRQEGQAPRALEVQPRVDAIDDVAAQVVAGEHDALAEARGAAGVVQLHELVAGHVGIVDVVAIEAALVFLFEEVGQVIDDLAHRLARLLGQQLAAVERDGRANALELFEVERLPDGLAREQQYGLAVVDDVLGVGGVELLQDGHDDCTVGDGGDVDGHPHGRVLADEGHLVAGFDAAVLKEQVHTGDVAGKVAIGHCGLLVVVAQCGQLPVVDEAFLENLDGILFQHKSCLF